MVKFYCFTFLYPTCPCTGAFKSLISTPDVVVLQQNEPDDSGSETGSESMFETAPINETIEETKEQATLRLPVDTDYHSDASSDILEPTQVV